MGLNSGWRKLHLAVAADSSEINAHCLTDQETGGASQLESLLGQIDNQIDQFNADGAHGGDPSYNAVPPHSPGARVSFHHSRARLNAQVSCRDTITSHPC
jgi:hypothetical protein